MKFYKDTKMHDFIQINLLASGAHYSVYTLTLFRLSFSGRPGLGGGVKRRPPLLRFLKTIKDIDMKLTTLIKRREVNI